MTFGYECWKKGIRIQSRGGTTRRGVPVPQYEGKRGNVVVTEWKVEALEGSGGGPGHLLRLACFVNLFVRFLILNLHPTCTCSC